MYRVHVVRSESGKYTYVGNVPNPLKEIRLGIRGKDFYPKEFESSWDAVAFAEENGYEAIM
jgi:hypothetical protein